MKQKIYTVFLACILLFMSLSMILFPEESLHASIRGLDTWWRIVFPSLLPFFIAAELLIRLGVVKFIGVLFEPIMRPLFNVPGIGSFAWIVGMASGYPSGAKISAMLRDKGQITQIEAERLVSFTNAASPLFIFGAIAVGLFHKPELGMLLAICHYSGNMLVGFVMRFYDAKNKTASPESPQRLKQKSIITRAFQQMHRMRLTKKQPIGEVIGESVTASVQTLLMIGGFIILFSVFTSLLEVTKLTLIFQAIFTPIFLLFQLPVTLIPALFTGLFEITLGSHQIIDINSITLQLQLTAISFILGFNGFSIHAQVASILSQTDIRYKAYFYGRLLHAFFSSFICIIVVTIFSQKFPALEQSKSVFMFISEQPYHYLQYMYYIGPAVTIFSIMIAFIYICRQLTNKFNKLY